MQIHLTFYGLLLFLVAMAFGLVFTPDRYEDDWRDWLSTYPARIGLTLVLAGVLTTVLTFAWEHMA